MQLMVDRERSLSEIVDLIDGQEAWQAGTWKGKDSETGI